MKMNVIRFFFSHLKCCLSSFSPSQRKSEQCLKIKMFVFCFIRFVYTIHTTSSMLWKKIIVIFLSLVTFNRSIVLLHFFFCCSLQINWMLLLFIVLWWATSRNNEVHHFFYRELNKMIKFNLFLLIIRSENIQTAVVMCMARIRIEGIQQSHNKSFR